MRTLKRLIIEVHSLQIYGYISFTNPPTPRVRTKSNQVFCIIVESNKNKIESMCYRCFPTCMVNSEVE